MLNKPISCTQQSNKYTSLTSGETHKYIISRFSSIAHYSNQGNKGNNLNLRNGTTQYGNNTMSMPQCHGNFEVQAHKIMHIKYSAE